MTAETRYYNKTYAQCELDLDERGNTFEKIRSLWKETSPHMSILDLGCGAGSVSGDLVQRGHRVVGLDITEEAIQRACSRGLNAQVFDLNEPLLLETASFDCVLALDVLEHLFDPLSMLEEIHRVLRKEGYLLLFLPLHFDIRQRWRVLLGRGVVSHEHLYYSPSNKAWNYFHIRFFTIAEAFAMLQQAGFVVEAEPDYRPVFVADLPYLVRKWLSWPRLKRLSKSWPSLFASGVLLRLQKT